MVRLVAFIQDVVGRHIGDGVYLDEPQAVDMIARGVVMDAKEYQKMLEDKKEHAKEMRHVREDKDKKEDKKEVAEMPVSYQAMAADEESRSKESGKKAPEAPKKDKMIRSPKKKKAVAKSKSEPAEPVMRWRK